MFFRRTLRTPSRAGLFAGLVFASLDGCSAPNTNPSDATVPTDGAVDAPSPADALAPVDATAPADDGAAAPTRVYESEISYDLAPGEERTMCVVQRLANDSASFVRRVSASLGDASHHLIVYRSQQTEVRATPYRCIGFAGVRSLDQADTPMLIAQQAEAELRLPNGVGLAIGATQMVMLEFHAINTSRELKTARARVRIEAVDQTTAGYAAADVMFWGNTNIALPPRAPSRVEFFHRPWGGVRIFGLTSHTHRFGRRASIHVATAQVDESAGTRGKTYRNITDQRLLHESLNWSDPPFTTFDPPLRLSGEEGLHLSCEYNNTSDATVRFGESANDEMCFLWAYYYPAPRGTQLCGVDLSPDLRGVLCYPP